MPAGYSGKPIATKLGFKSGMRAIFVNKPLHYKKLVGNLPAEFEVKSRLAGKFDLKAKAARRCQNLRGR